MRKLLISSTLAFAMLAAPLGAAYASAASDSLAECLHSNATSSDKESLIQWAYVTLSRTDAAKKVQVIKDATVNGVETKAQKALSTLVVQKCSKPAMKLLLSDPRNGLQDSLTNLAKRLIDDEISRRASPLLKMNITDILNR